MGLITRRLENGQDLEEEDESIFSDLLAPLIGAHPLYGHVLAADILRHASHRGVEPSITNWVAGVRTWNEVRNGDVEIEVTRPFLFVV